MKPIYSKNKLLLFLTAAAYIGGCVHTYSHEPIEIHVVDAETNKPLEGVIAVAQWSLSKGSIGGNVETGTLNVMETISNTSGRIYFPNWGPITAFNGILDYKGAQLSFFRTGYSIFETQNPDTTWRAKHPNQSQWNGKTVSLKKFIGTSTDYSRQLTYLDISLESITSRSNNCAWKNIPEMVIAIQKEKARLDDQGIDTSGIRGIELFSSKNCGSPVEFFSQRTKK